MPHFPPTHMTVSHGCETRGPSVRAVPWPCVLYMGIVRERLAIFLGIPNQKASQKSRGVSSLETPANYMIVLSLLPAKGHPTADKALPSALCENRICGNTLCWLFLHVLSLRSKKRRRSLRSTLIWVVYLVLDGKNAGWNTVFTSLLLYISCFRVCMSSHLCEPVCVYYKSYNLPQLCLDCQSRTQHRGQIKF